VTTPERRPKTLKPSTVQTILTWEGSMSSSTAARATGRGGHYAEREGYGLIIFAFVLPLVLSFFSLIDGLAPFWSLMIIAVDVVALWGLCLYGSRQNLAS
jgi:hypothetical protein